MGNVKRLDLEPEEIYFLEPVIKQVARVMVRRFGRRLGVTWEDLISEGWIWILERPGAYRTARAIGDENDQQRYLHSILSRGLTKLLRSASDASVGIVPGDQHTYTQDFIKLVLADATDPDVTYRLHALRDEGDDGTGRSSNADPAYGANWMTMLTDVRIAYDKLNSYDQGLLDDYCIQGLPMTHMADARNVSDTTIRKHIFRALATMQGHLGGTDEPVEPPERPLDDTERYAARRMRSNASALAELREIY